MEQFSFVCVGHVDHGKSSLIGRLLIDTDSVQEEALEKVRRICDERGKRFEPAFLLDAFAEEREQGITIDTLNIEFSTDQREYTIIDAPGHKEFLKNMASGASRAEAALLLVDAKEGVQEQTRKHAHVLSLLGIGQVAVVVNKMDLVDYDEERFQEVEQQVIEYLQRLDIHPSFVVPCSAIDGDNVLEASGELSWYEGPSVIEVIDLFESSPPPAQQALRLPIQDVYKFDERRIVAGRVESGVIKEGDEVVVWPSQKSTTVKSVEYWPKGKEQYGPGESAGVTLSDEFFLKRGEVITHPGEKPIISTLFEATVFWMGTGDLVMGKEYVLKLASQQVPCKVHAINEIIDAQTLEALDRKDAVKRYETAKIVLQTDDPVVFDPHSQLPSMGRFVLVDEFDVAGGGIVESVPQVLRERSSVRPRSMFISPKESLVSLSEREARNEHRGLVVWVSGLAGCGKEKIAQALERELFDAGISAYYVDSSNVRMSLSSDLAFSKQQRSEHSRRVAELANYLRSAGHVVIVSIISPFREDRELARDLVGRSSFMEVFVDTPLAVCESVNPHGIYSKARKKEISGVPGVDIEYEPSEGLVQLLSVQSADFDASAKARELAQLIEEKVRD